MPDLAPTTALPPAHAARVFAALGQRYSANTLRTYRAAWRAWQEWADRNDADPLPAEPAAVAAYLSERAETRSMATVRMGAAAIAEAHRQIGSTNPVASTLVRNTLQGLGRQAAQSGRAGQRQAGALTDDALKAIRATACKPRVGRGGHMETAETARRRGLVDIALCQTMADGGLRRSEAAALTWARVDRERDGSGRLSILHSKTDAEGRGAVVAVTKRAMRDLAAIRGDAPDAAPVFGLAERPIHDRIRAAAIQAGLGDGFGGHSGRVGLARRMTQNGAPMQAVMLQGRWMTPGMVGRYTRNEAAGAALRYL